MATEERTIRVVTETDADSALNALKNLQSEYRKFQELQQKAAKGGQEWDELESKIQETKTAIKGSHQAFSQYFK